MPGVVVNTGVRVGPAGAEAAPASTFFVVGTAERGPVDEARLVTSMSDFEKWYGGYYASGTLHEHVQTFFEEGGTRCYVMRIVDELAVAASATQNGGTVNTDIALTYQAANPGTWGNGIVVTTTTGVASATFRVTVTLDDATVFQSGDLASNSVAAATINAAIPQYLTVTVGNAADTDIPAAETVTFSSGAETLSALADAAFVSALDAYFGAELGTGAVAIPEREGSAIWTGLQSHAMGHNRIALCGMDDNQAVSATVVDADFTAFYGTNDGEKEAGSYMAFYYPHIKIPDGAGGTRTISPESFAAAARCRAHLEAGPWRAGAGLISSGRFATGISRVITKANGDTLDEARINAIRLIDNTVRVYGARSVSADEDNWRFITFRDVVNYVSTTAEAALEDYVFSVIDGRKTIFAKVASELVSILEPIREAGGFFERLDNEGRPIDRGYSVDVSNALNPVADLAAGTVRANVGVRVSSVSDLINVTITKSGLTTAV